MPRMAFNASPRELRDDGYVERVVAALERHGLGAGPGADRGARVARCRSTTARASVLERLHELGVKLALDDFGTEHSSLSRLRELPVQVLKVDRSFLRDVPGDAAGARSCARSPRSAPAWAWTSWPRGSRHREQLRFAAAAGCGFGQGYHFARPLPAAQVTPLLTSSLARSRRAARATARSPAASPR